MLAMDLRMGKKKRRRRKGNVHVGAGDCNRHGVGPGVSVGGDCAGEVCIGAEAEGATGVALGIVQERPAAERV